MNEDRRRVEQYASERDAELRSWLSSAVYPHSAVIRQELDAAGLGRRGVRTASDLARLPTVRLAELADGRAHVLEPTVASIAAHGPPQIRLRLRVADVFGRRPELAREHVDPRFRPVLWTVSGELFVSSTGADLDRLAELGRRSLSISGVRQDDRMLVLDPAGGRIGPWQLLSGARDAGIAVLHADEAGPELVERAAPTVLAGRASSLCAAVASGLPASVRLLIVHDGALPDDRQQTTLGATGLPVAEWWQAPSARAAWIRCPGGRGFHTWPTDEVVEVLDETGHRAERGELVWSAVGWFGSVWLRVRTGVAVAVDPEPCGACGRTTPRVDLLPTDVAGTGAQRRRRREPVRA